MFCILLFTLQVVSNLFFSQFFATALLLQWQFGAQSGGWGSKLRVKDSCDNMTFSSMLSFKVLYADMVIIINNFVLSPDIYFLCNGDNWMIFSNLILLPFPLNRHLTYFCLGWVYLFQWFRQHRVTYFSVGLFNTCNTTRFVLFCQVELECHVK